MSRDFEGDWDYDGPPPWGRYNAALKSATMSRTGLARLEEMERALLALPRPRLIDGYLAESVEFLGNQMVPEMVLTTGEVCAVGAFCAYKIAKREGRSIYDGITAVFDQYGDEPSADDTAEAGHNEGLTWTLAWEIGSVNDEWRKITPEDRYERVLAWVRTTIKQAKEFLMKRDGIVVQG